MASSQELSPIRSEITLFSPETMGMFNSAEFMTPNEFTLITTRNVRAVIFARDAVWEGNIALLPDKIIIPTIEVPNAKPEVIPQFQLDLNSRLSHEQMALALLSKVATMRQHIFVKEHGTVSSWRFNTATEEQRKVFYEQNRDLVDGYLDSEISKFPQSPAIAGIFRNAAGYMNY